MDKWTDQPVYVALHAWKHYRKPGNRSPQTRWTIGYFDTRLGRGGAWLCPATAISADEQMAADLLCTVKRFRGQARVTLPKQRGALAERLRFLGVPTTDEPVANRAQQLATMRADRASTDLVRQRENAARHPSGGRHALPPETPWPAWPSFESIRDDHRDELIIATDASKGDDGLSSIALVSASGDISVQARWTEMSIGQLEFAGVTRAMEVAARKQPRILRILCDSQEAITATRRLSTRGAPPEMRKSIPMDLQWRFVDALHQMDAVVEIAKVQGHSGHFLNTLADSAAQMTRKAASQLPLDTSASLEQKLLSLVDRAPAQDGASGDTTLHTPDAPGSIAQRQHGKGRAAPGPRVKVPHGATLDREATDRLQSAVAQLGSMPVRVHPR